jgi:hypothetical protein
MSQLAPVFFFKGRINQHLLIPHLGYRDILEGLHANKLIHYCKYFLGASEFEVLFTNIN